MALYNENSLPQPKFISLNNISNFLNKASAKFYRTELNSNIEIFIPIGNMVDQIYLSPDVYLPNLVFNNKKETSILKYPNNRDLLVMQTSLCLHNILIQYKLNKSSNSNFANQREIRITIVKSDGTLYDLSILANYQPDTGSHSTIILNEIVEHNIGDIVKIKFNIVQDNKLGDYSDTQLTIFNISWNVESIKNF